MKRTYYGRIDLSRTQRDPGKVARWVLLLAPLAFTLLSFLALYLQDLKAQTFIAWPCVAVTVGSVVSAGISLAAAGVLTERLSPDFRVTGALFGGLLIMLLTAAVPLLLTGHWLVFLTIFVPVSQVTAFQAVFFTQLSLLVYSLFRCLRGR